jgi:hypothetical protein
MGMSLKIALLIHHFEKLTLLFQYMAKCRCRVHEAHALPLSSIWSFAGMVSFIS